MQNQPHITPQAFLEAVCYAETEGHSWWFVRVTTIPTPLQRRDDPHTFLKAQYLYANLRAVGRRTLNRTPWQGLEALWIRVQSFCGMCPDMLFFLNFPEWKDTGHETN